MVANTETSGLHSNLLPLSSVSSAVQQLTDRLGSVQLPRKPNTKLRLFLAAGALALTFGLPVDARAQSADPNACSLSQVGDFTSNGFNETCICSALCGSDSQGQWTKYKHSCSDTCFPEQGIQFPPVLPPNPVPNSGGVTAVDISPQIGQRPLPQQMQGGRLECLVWRQDNGDCTKAVFVPDNPTEPLSQQVPVPTAEPIPLPTPTAIPTPTQIPLPPTITNAGWQIIEEKRAELVVNAVSGSANNPVDSITVGACERDKGKVGAIVTDSIQADQQQSTIIPVSIEPNGQNCFQLIARSKLGLPSVPVETEFGYSAEISASSDLVTIDKTGKVSISGQITSTLPLSWREGYLSTCGDQDRGSRIGLERNGTFDATLQLDPGTINRVCVDARDAQGGVVSTEIVLPEPVTYSLKLGDLVKIQNPDKPNEWFVAGNPGSDVDFSSITATCTQPRKYLGQLFGIQGKCNRNEVISEGIKIKGQEYSFAMVFEPRSDVHDIKVKIDFANTAGSAIASESLTFDYPDNVPLQDWVKLAATALAGLFVTGGLTATGVGGVIALRKRLEYMDRRANFYHLLGTEADGNQRYARFNRAQNYVRGLSKGLSKDAMLKVVEVERAKILRKGISAIERATRGNPDMPHPISGTYEVLSKSIAGDMKLLEDLWSGQVQMDQINKAKILREYVCALEKYIEGVFYEPGFPSVPTPWTSPRNRSGINMQFVLNDFAEYCSHLISSKDNVKNAFWKSICEQNPNLALKLFEIGVAQRIGIAIDANNNVDFASLPAQFKGVFPAELTRNKPIYYVQCALDRKMPLSGTFSGLSAMSPSDREILIPGLIATGDIETGTRLLFGSGINIGRLINGPLQNQAELIIYKLMAQGNYSGAHNCILSVRDELAESRLWQKYDESTRKVLGLFVQKKRAGVPASEFVKTYSLPAGIVKEVEQVETAENAVNSGNFSAIVEQGRCIEGADSRVGPLIADAVVRGLDRVYKRLELRLPDPTALPYEEALTLLKASEESWFQKLPIDTNVIVARAKEVAVVYSAWTVPIDQFRALWKHELEDTQRATGVVELLCRQGNFETALACVSSHQDEKHRQVLRQIYENEVQTALETYAGHAKMGRPLAEVTQYMRFPQEAVGIAQGFESFYAAQSAHNIAGVINSADIIYASGDRFRELIRGDLNVFFEEISGTVAMVFRKHNLARLNELVVSNAITALSEVERRVWFNDLVFSGKEAALHKSRALHFISSIRSASEPDAIRTVLERSGQIATLQDALHTVELLCDWGDYTGAQACVTLYTGEKREKLQDGFFHRQQQLALGYAGRVKQRNPVSAEKYLQGMRVPEQLRAHCEHVDFAYRALEMPDVASGLRSLSQLCISDENLVPIIRDDAEQYIERAVQQLSGIVSSRNWNVLSDSATVDFLNTLQGIDGTLWYQAIAHRQQDVIRRQAQMLRHFYLLRTNSPHLRQNLINARITSSFPEAKEFVEMACEWGDYLGAQMCINFYTGEKREKLEEYLVKRNQQLVADYSQQAKGKSPVSAVKFFEGKRVSTGVLARCGKIQQIYEAVRIPNQVAGLQTLASLFAADALLVPLVQAEIGSIIESLAERVQGIYVSGNWAVLSSRPVAELLTVVDNLSPCSWFASVKHQKKDILIQQVKELRLLHLVNSAKEGELQQVFSKTGVLSSYSTAGSLIGMLCDWGNFAAAQECVKLYSGARKTDLETIYSKKVDVLMQRFQDALLRGGTGEEAFVGVQVTDAIRARCKDEIVAVHEAQFVKVREALLPVIINGDYIAARSMIERSGLTGSYKDRLRHYLMIDRVIRELQLKDIRTPDPRMRNETTGELALFDIRSLLRTNAAEEFLPQCIESLTETQFRELLLSLILVRIIPSTLQVGALEFRMGPDDKLICHHYPNAKFKLIMREFHPDLVDISFSQLPPGKRAALKLFMAEASQTVSLCVGSSKDDVELIAISDRKSVDKKEFSNLLILLALIFPGRFQDRIQGQTLVEVKQKLVEYLSK